MISTEEFDQRKQNIDNFMSANDQRQRLQMEDDSAWISFKLFSSMKINVLKYKLTLFSPDVDYLMFHGFPLRIVNFYTQYALLYRPKVLILVNFAVKMVRLIGRKIQ